MKSELTDVELEWVHETDAAILVSDGDKKVWLPKSRVEYTRKPKTNLVVVTMPTGLAFEKELI